MKPALSKPNRRTSRTSRTSRPIQFVFLAPAARQVSLAGDFNDWNPTLMPMNKAADGMWHLTVTLQPGRHEYRFFADGVWQDDPIAQLRTSNSLGGENCVRIVVAREEIVVARED